jgi:hypothetical protein
MLIGDKPAASREVWYQAGQNFQENFQKISEILPGSGINLEKY